LVIYFFKEYDVPRIFSQEQRGQLQKKLMEEGRKVFSEFGLKKTRIEDITRRVGIAKGTFYSFFPSKEALLLAAMDELEAEAQPLFKKILEDENENPKQRLKQVLRMQLESVRENPIVETLFNPEEIAYLTRNLPPDALSGHIREHNRFFLAFLEGLARRGRLRTEDINTAGALLQTIFFLAIHKKEIGPDFYKQMELLIELLAEGLIKDRPTDTVRRKNAKEAAHD
jgi:AcrR family transcriptional regulator